MTKEDALLILEAPEFALRELERAVERYERAYTRVAGGAIRYDKDKVDGGGGDPDMPLIMVAQRSIELDEAQAGSPYVALRGDTGAYMAADCRSPGLEPAADVLTEEQRHRRALRHGMWRRSCGGFVGGQGGASPLSRVVVLRVPP